MEMSGQLHAPAVLLPGKESQYPFDRRLNGPQRRFGRDDKDKKFLSVLEIEPRSSDL